MPPDAATGTRKRRTAYSSAQRNEAMALAAEVGNRAAADQLGLPVGTVHRWRSGNDVAGRIDASRQQVERNGARLAELRSELRTTMLTSAVYCASMSGQSTKGSDAQGFATAAAILIDKVRLELGEHTSAHLSAHIGDTAELGDALRSIVEARSGMAGQMSRAVTLADASVTETPPS